MKRLIDADEIELNKKIIQNIRALLRMKNIKIGQLEKTIGVSVGYVSRLENGEKRMGFNTIYKAAQTLGVTVDELITGEFRKEILREHANKLREELNRIEQELGEE